MFENENLGNAQDNLKEVFKLLEKWKGIREVPAIELDLAKEKMRAVYDILCNNGEAVYAQPTKEIPVPLPPVVKQPEELETRAQEKKSTLKRGDPALPVDQQQPLGTKVHVAEKATRAEEKKSEKEILADKFKGKKSLHDELSKHNQADLATRHQSKPIHDIAAAMGLNDKFLFTRDLFGGNPALFQSTVEKLNNATNFEEALGHIEHVMKWDLNDPVVNKFIHLVKRKHNA